jgi:hypothetical protein
MMEVVRTSVVVVVGPVVMTSVVVTECVEVTVGIEVIMQEQPSEISELANDLRTGIRSSVYKGEAYTMER